MTTVQIHAKSPADGDLVLHGTDGVGVRFHSFQLKAHSAFFRVMLETKSDSPTIKMPDITTDQLLEMRKAMDAGYITPSDWESLPSTFFNACEKYEMPLIACMKVRALGETLSNQNFSDRLALLLIASKLDCVDAAVRIFAHNSRGHWAKSMPGGTEFTIETAKKFPASWVYAAHKARDRTLRTNPKVEEGRDYWVIFAGCFVLELSGY